MATTLGDYANKYQHIKFERRDGILQVTFHTNDGPFQWGLVPHRECAEAFRDIATDRGNKAVILTGTGDSFSGPKGNPGTRPNVEAAEWDVIHWEGRELLWNELSIEVPMIAAINGPAFRHPEIPLLCDIVLAASDTKVQDSGHFINGMVPGDGVHIVFPLLMGWNRGRYFLITGQELSVQEAKDAGLVNEILPREQLLPRAWELASQIVTQPPLTIRYGRLLVTHYLKSMMHDMLGYGLALEGLSLLDTPRDQGYKMPD
ncbi:MAG: enoyl-CoA hydratase/isomerase family protein [Chloroflexi bacterium]|nr:enoyl-CoA hydratase/isomerase family protein [Chloroflexota bacterium]